MRDRSAPFKASSPFSIGAPLSGPRESRSRSRDGYPPAVVTIRLSPEEKFSFSNFYPIVSCSSLRWMLIFFLSVLIRYRRRVSGFLFGCKDRDDTMRGGEGSNE